MALRSIRESFARAKARGEGGPQDPALAARPGPESGRWFGDEVYAHDASLKSYLRSAYPAVRDIEDVVQESYLRVWRRQLAPPIADAAGSVRASVKSFLFRVARNLAIDALRRRRASLIIPVTEAGGLVRCPRRIFPSGWRGGARAGSFGTLRSPTRSS